jgi:hypothetical protein
MLVGLAVTTLINLKSGQRAAKASAPSVFRLQAHFTSHGERPWGLAGAKFQARESSDNPRLKAFCRVAPSVRFKVLAMLAALVFFFARVFNVRTCAGVHERRFEFLAI